MSDETKDRLALAFVAGAVLYLCAVVLPVLWRINGW